ncbi:uncharacterized protein LOC110190794 [Drosophila serrata]|uniref:uncharacterized protein LOC110190794 n=1 Tax=Drosophila serrata TaxID=7274 RepID=UPI000A1CF622|nr:uncharacterized protein LOC110190794 [Drosophila serrata]
MMTHDIDSMLIHSVSRHPRLYDKSFGSNSMISRREAWSDVAAECKVPMDLCQSRWRALRDRYVREINKPNPKGFPLFEKLNFLREHVHLKRKCPSSTSDQQTTSYTYYIDEMTQDEAPSSMITEFPLEQNQEQLQEQEHIQNQGHNQQQEQEYLSDNADTSSVEFVAEQTVIDNESTDQTQPLPLPANNQTPAMEHLSSFAKVINMLEQALKEKSKPIEPQDPFYKYLESILSRVDERTRCDIQLRLLNLAHEEINRAGII